MKPAPDCEIRSLAADEARARAGALGAVLVDCVAGGASVGFMAELTQAEATRFFEGSAQEVAAGRTVLLAAFADSDICGTVQVKFASMPNQPHRADLAKMLVHRRMRRRGIGARLIAAAESEAAKVGRNLLCLDTAVGGEAENLYRSCGWTECGVIPDYAMWPDGRFCATRLFYKRIGGLA